MSERIIPLVKLKDELEDFRTLEGKPIANLASNICSSCTHTLRGGKGEIIVLTEKGPTLHSPNDVPIRIRRIYSRYTVCLAGCQIRKSNGGLSELYGYDSPDAIRITELPDDTKCPKSPYTPFN